jgi:hypothetical protein
MRKGRADVAMVAISRPAAAGDTGPALMAIPTHEQLEALSLIAESDRRGTVMPQKSMTEVAGFPSGVIMALLREGLIVVRLELMATAGHTAMTPMVKITDAGRQAVARSSAT